MKVVQFGYRTLKSVEGEVCNSGAQSSLTTQEWLTTQEAAIYLGVSEGALRNMASNGQVPYYKLGRRNRYRVADLRALLLSQKRGGMHVD